MLRSSDGALEDPFRSNASSDSISSSSACPPPCTATFSAPLSSSPPLVSTPEDERPAAPAGRMSAALAPSAVASMANLFQSPHAPPAAPSLAASSSSTSTATAEPRAPLELKRKLADAAASETEEKRTKVVKAVRSIDDDAGFLRVRIGSIILNRYKVVAFIGKGTFANVYHCDDRVAKRPVALKVVRNVEKYNQAARTEIETLERLRQADPGNSKHCAHILASFKFKDHIVMVFDKLGLSLFDFLKSNSYRGFAVPHVKLVGLQLLRATKFLHDLSIIHTDIKIENIMLLDSSHTMLEINAAAGLFTRLPKSVDVQLIDFGSVILQGAAHPALVTTRHYRAPEIVLGRAYSLPVDIFSIGCVLFELFTGRLLFDTHHDDEHLKLIERALGAFPASFAPTAPRHFREDGTLMWNAHTASKQSRDAVRKCVSLEESLRHANDPLFVDLLRRMLCLDADARITASGALDHPWFRM